jgi:soluble P-type ATPase
MRKPGITINIPGFGKVQINSILSDYTGTLACGGNLVFGVKDRLIRLPRLRRAQRVAGLSAEQLTKGG